MCRFNTLGKSATEIQQIVLETRRANPSVTQLLGRWLILDSLGTKPHKDILDAVVDDIPVFIDAVDLHSCWLNSAALRVLGIDENTKPPTGGEFENDDKGGLTGLVLESVVFDIIWPYLAGQLTLQDRLTNLQKCFEEYLETGVTGAVDMAMEEQDLEALEVYLDQHGRLPIRVFAYMFVKPSGIRTDPQAVIHRAAQHRQRLHVPNAWLSVVGVKFMLDGAIDSCTAYMKEPFINGSHPSPLWPKDQLQPLITLADSLDLQIAFHALGDAASELALDCIQSAINTNGRRALRRHRLEHLETITEESIRRLHDLGVVASLQPAHCDPVLLPNWMDVLGPGNRRDRAFPFTEFITAKTEIAFGSDCPVVPHHPFPGMYTATTRKSTFDLGKPPPTDPHIIALERFSIKLDEAIRFYTAGAAYSISRDGMYGTLQRGKMADFCILSFDPFAKGVETLRDAQQGVSETWVAGVRMWKRELVE